MPGGVVGPVTAPERAGPPLCRAGWGGTRTAPSWSSSASGAGVGASRRLPDAERDRQRKLIAKIGAATRRLYEGEYGYCEVSGDPISLARLEARPIATMTLEAQERHERIEKVSRDD